MAYGYWRPTPDAAVLWDSFCLTDLERLVIPIKVFRAALARHYRIDADDAHLLWIRPIHPGSVNLATRLRVFNLNVNRRRALISFGEDASRVRTGNAGQDMALLRDAAIGLLAGLGFASVPAAYRWVGYDCFTRPLDLLGIA